MTMTKLLFSFKGQIGRGPFWLGTFLAWIYYALAFSVYKMLGGPDIGSLNPFAAASGGTTLMGANLSLAFLVFSIALIAWIDLALQVKRWHDRGKSGWWVLICLTGGGLVWALAECGLIAGRALAKPDFESMDMSSEMVAIAG